jgi:Domain of unknown function (DUF4186)
MRSASALLPSRCSDGDFPTRDIDQLFLDLAKSPFRRRFRLCPQELRYLESKGFSAVLAEAADLVSKRLGSANPSNDGKQTPFKGHPVFIAQHATATCCRGCLAKWHGIRKGEALDPTRVDPRDCGHRAMVENSVSGQSGRARPRPSSMNASAAKIVRSARCG